MIKFSKMQAIGNDFVVVAKDDAQGRAYDKLALDLCDRHFGVGGDGLLVLGPGTGDCALDFRMFNPDGTEDMCGNGLRCAALWGYRRGLIAEGQTFLTHGFDRNRECRLVQVGENDNEALVAVDMGIADFVPANIPYLGAQGDRLSAAGSEWAIHPVSTGSTHAVIFGDVVSEDTFRSVSPQIENHPDFPERTSVMWTTELGNNEYAVRIWERAAGETLGCGTGMAAIAAVAWREGKSPSDAEIKVRSKGGELRFVQDAKGNIQMTGPAEWVFDGVLD
jgi:diaminopimelate epimerase